MPVLTALLLLSCSPTKEAETIKEEQKKDYDDFAQYTIGWNRLFDIKEDSYHVYFFSRTCGHCNRIKEQVLKFGEFISPTFYLCEYSEDVPIKSCPSNTIGVDSVENAYICGTPSMIFINDKKIELNLCGENTISLYIKDYINTN